MQKSQYACLGANTKEGMSNTIKGNVGLNYFLPLGYNLIIREQNILISNQYKKKCQISSRILFSKGDVPNR